MLRGLSSGKAYTSLIEVVMITILIIICLKTGSQEHRLLKKAMNRNMLIYTRGTGMMLMNFGPEKEDEPVSETRTRRSVNRYFEGRGL